MHQEPLDVVAAPTPSPTAVSPPPRRRISRETLALIPLLLIILLGAYFRFTGLNWDDDTHLHPDERFLTIVTAKLETTSDPFLYLRTSESPLNPYNKNEGFYVYGNFPMTLTRYIAEWVNNNWYTHCTDRSALLCGRNLIGYDGIHLIGRILSGLMDLLSITLTFFIGRRLYGTKVGLLAAFLLATAVMPIQQSHFYTMDNWAAALTTLTLYTAVRASEDGHRKRWWVLFGLTLGLTVASRINVAPLALMAGVSALIWLVRQHHASRTSLPLWRYLTGTNAGGLSLQHALMGVMIAALISMVTFRLAQPYAFADQTIAYNSYVQEYGQEPSTARLFLQSIIGFNPQWRGNMEEIQRLQAPEANFPPALQWVNRTAVLFPLANMLLYGMGLLAGIIAWLGFAAALWRIAQARPGWLVHALPVTWTGLYFLFAATRWVKSIRYFLPIYPTLFLLAGWLLFTLWHRADGRTLHRALAGIAITLTALSSLIWANAFIEIYRQPMTRVAASTWIYENIPSAATLFYQTANGEKQLQLPLRSFDFQPGAIAYPLGFELPEDGTLTAVRFNKLTSPNPDHTAQATIQIALNGAFGEGNMAQATANVGANSQTPISLPIDLPHTFLRHDMSHTLYISLTPTSDPLRADTSVLTSEHWDDPLPARILRRDPFSQYYNGLKVGAMPVTHPDNEQKRLELYGWLDEADYVILSSQRFLWSLPRLPLTYPLMQAYYQGLFDGSLGFEKVAEFHADIHVGPLYISDTAAQIGWGAPPTIGWPPPNELAAEEAFSVYDHPPVWVFAKRDDFDLNNAIAQLNRVDLTQTIVMNPLEATNAPNAMMLTAEQAATQQSGGTFAEIFNPDGILSNNSFVAVIVWWLAVVAIGWLAFPICFVVFRGLADRGFALARIFGLLWLSFLPWLTASWQWLPNTRPTLFLSLGVMALISLGIALRHRPELSAFVLKNWRLLLILEGVGASLYLFQLLIRLGNPDAWHVIWGGEKPMDMSYFTAVMKSETFPPYDPWLAGGYLNYYYYGFVYAGGLAKLLRVVPAVAYNLILPMLYSMAGTAVFSLAYTFAIKQSRTKIALLGGAMATLMSMVLGNLAQLGVIFSAWERTSNLPPDANPLLRVLDGGWRIIAGGASAPIYTGDWFWLATRAISINEGEVAPITEFPFFTFLYGDLHAHMIALPLTMLALGWAISVATQPTHKSPRYATAETLLYWLVGGLAIGVLYPTNSWDYPTYLVIGALALFFHGWRKQGINAPMLAQWLLKTSSLFTLSLLAFWPFWANFGTGYSSIKLWEGSFTTTGNYLTIYGLFLLIIGTWILVELKSWGQSWTEEFLAQRTAAIVAAVATLALIPLALIFFLGWGYDVALVVVPLLVLAGIIGVWSNAIPERKVALVLVASGLGLTLFVEAFVLDGDVGRMNTVFKFYMQVWMLFSVVGGAAVAWLWPLITAEWGGLRQRLWQTTAVALLLIALLYPLLATRAKWQIRMDGQNPTARTTLNGLDFMRYVSYGDSGQDVPLNHDYEAIKWMHRHIKGSPIIAEAHSGNPYRSVGNRIATYTGLPAIVGWDWHQRQQRTTTPGWLVSRRINDVNTLYNTDNITTAQTILNQYNVSYIYVGQLEWIYYAPPGLNKFEEMAAQGLLEEVYRNSGASLYKVLSN